VEGDKTVIGDGHAMGGAGQVLEHLVGLAERFFDRDHPLLMAQGCEQTLPGRGLGELPTATLEGQLAAVIEVLESLEVEAPDASREDWDGQEEVGSTRHPARAIRGQAPGG
jgi:hypothetical protein